MNMLRKFKPGNFRFRVARSKTGLGLYTEDAIPKDACVIEYIGRPATPKEQKEDTGKYLFWTSDTTMINGNIPENTARYINHSCDPNCESDYRKRRIYIFAIKNIRPGEELTYNYGPEYMEQHFTKGGCQCPKCEKKRSKSKAKTIK